ncbi:MAG: Bax inhibitor-1 family protein [Bacteroidia bacterium]|jgi:FtsH-binding integral membrane protein|nr:Bax inhibitor-1 family protein [Bacteroidia bacterium]
MEREPMLERDRVVTKRFFQGFYALLGINIIVTGFLGGWVCTYLWPWLAPMERHQIGIVELVMSLGLFLSFGLLLPYAKKERPPRSVFRLIVGWVSCGFGCGVALLPFFALGRAALTLKVLWTTGVVFIAAAMIMAFIGVDLTEKKGRVWFVRVALVLMGALALFLRSGVSEILWLYGGLLVWLFMARIIFEFDFESKEEEKQEVEIPTVIANDLREGLFIQRMVGMSMYVCTASYVFAGLLVVPVLAIILKLILK